MVVISREKGTVDIQGTGVVPTGVIHALEFVRYNLRGQRVTSVGLTRIALDLGPGSSPRYLPLELRASNMPELGEQLAQNLGVPFRARKLGTIQGHDFMAY